MTPENIVSLNKQLNNIKINFMNNNIDEAINMAKLLATWLQCKTKEIKPSKSKEVNRIVNNI